MKKYFIQFETKDENLQAIKRCLKDQGDLHQVLDNLYCFVTDAFEGPIALRDRILQLSENSRLIVVEIPDNVNSAWHLTVENSNWLKSVLDGK